MLDIVIGNEACHMHRAGVSARRFFQSKCINSSYQNQGQDAQIHRKEIVSNSASMIKLVVYNSGI